MTSDAPRKRFTWLPELLVAAAIVLGIRAYQQRDAVSGPAPAFEAASLEGGRVALADYAGKPVVLHFWASWCGVCRAMEGNVLDLGDAPVLRVATRSGPADAVRAYLASRGETDAPGVLLDPDGALAQRYGVRAFPTTYFLDAEGRILHTEVGYTTRLGVLGRLWLAGMGI